MKHFIAFTLVLLLVGTSYAAQKWTRVETTYTVQAVDTGLRNLKMTLAEPQDGAQLNSLNLENNDNINLTPIINSCLVPIYRGENLQEVTNKITHERMTEKEKWYLNQEIKFLNLNKMQDGVFPIGASLIVPKYRPYNSNKRCCSDMRNMLVAVMKGRKHNVHWAYMIGVRSQENPSPEKDSYAYGVKHKRGTNLWVQADAAGEILARVTRNADNPSYSDIVKASRIYVGYWDGDWSRNVWAVMQRCQGKSDNLSAKDESVGLFVGMGEYTIEQGEPAWAVKIYEKYITQPEKLTMLWALATQYNANEGRQGKVDSVGAPCTMRTAASNRVKRGKYIWTKYGLRQVLDCGAHSNDRKADGRGCNFWVDYWYPTARNPIDGWNKTPAFILD